MVGCNTTKVNSYNNTKDTNKRLSILINIVQWIIHRISVAVEILRHFRVLHIGVRRKEASQGRVIETSIHVYQPKPREMFMTGVPSAKEQLRLFTGCIHFMINRATQTSPCVKTQFFFAAIRRNDKHDVAEYVTSDLVESVRNPISNKHYWGIIIVAKQIKLLH